jgi:hypothetical protein
MTYEEALQIAMEELYDAVENLRYNNKGYHAHIESQCNRLLTARNVLCKALEDAEEPKREWLGLTDEEIVLTAAALGGLASDFLVDVARAIEANLKEKNASQEQSEIERLRQVCRNVYEIWAGSDGIPVPETCAEGYLLRLIEQMRDEVMAGLIEEKNK